jgi:integral membrane protein (TIGR01906 family)
MNRTVAERANTWLASTVSWVIVLLMPFFIILTSLYVFMTPAFVQFEYSQPSFPLSERFTPEARLYNSVQTVHYVWGQISLTDLENLRVYNDREIKHLVDVQNVARGALIFHAVSGLLIAAGLIVLARTRGTRFLAARALVSGAILTLVVIAAIGVFSVVNFDAFFVTFHHIFFEGNSWLFEYTDSLIQFYPEPFWEAAAYGIALFVAVVSVLVGAVGWFWQRSLTQSRTVQAPA